MTLNRHGSVSNQLTEPPWYVTRMPGGVGGEAPRGASLSRLGSMMKFRRASEITPEEYELQVKTWIESVAGELDSFSANHREVLCSADGEYEIDVVVRFKALGVQFKALVECKKHKNPIKRELVQALHQKQNSLGANKAILVSTSNFQSGAVEFAKAHGIALVRLLSGVVIYIQGSKNNDASIPHVPADVDPYAGLLYSPEDGLIPESFNSHKNMALERFFTRMGPNSSLGDFPSTPRT